jgi:tetratricopeptide (TPR) repeat protein/transcriptional regulator with XRE-family HTH domain
VLVAEEAGDPRTLGVVLRERRTAAGLTQEQLAEQTGLGVRTIRDLERGLVSRPHRESIAMLAAALGLAPAALDELARAGRQPPAQPAPGAVAADGLVPRQLPPAVAHFAGRSDALKILTELAEEAAHGSRTVLISAIGGLAGVGKTALAVHFAHQVAALFPDGQLYLNLRGFDSALPPMTPAEAIRLVLDAFEMPPERIPASRDAKAGLYRSLLAGKRVLIVLDNVADAGQVRPLLPGTPGCLVIVTSRSRLAGLAAVDGATPLSLDVLTSDEARGLLTGILGAPRVSAEPDAADRVIQACGHLPLALAITAGRAATRPQLPLAALPAELAEAAGRLDALHTANDPLASVRTAIACSYQQLSAGAARTFRLLGVHPGPDISVLAAASLTGLPGPQAARHLTELADASLLRQDAAGRCALHDLVRLYAAEQAALASGESRAAATRMLDHYLHTVHGAALLLRPTCERLTLAAPAPGVTPEDPPDLRRAAAWLEAEHQVLLAAVTLAAEAGFDVYAWQLPRILSPYLDGRGDWNEQAAVQRTALAAATRLGDKAGQAASRFLLAHARARLGRYDEASVQLTECLGLYRELGDHVGQARVHQNMAWVNGQQDRHADALSHAQQTLVLHQDAGNQAGQAGSLNDVGWYHAMLCDYQQARAFCREALDLQRDLANPPGEAAALDSLGYAEHQLGHLAEAADCYQQAISIYRELGDRSCEAETLTHLGDTCHTADDTGAARSAWQEALAILDDQQSADAEQVRARLRAARDRTSPARK